MAKLGDLKDLTNHCDQNTANHKALVERVNVAAAATSKSTEEMQGNITVLLSGQENLKEKLARLEEENKSLQLLLKEALSMMPKRGKKALKAKQQDKRSSSI